MSTPNREPSSGQQWGPMFDGNYDTRVGLRQGGSRDRMRDRLVKEEQQKLQRQNWEPATVINLNPFGLLVYLGDMGTLTVPACPHGDDYARLVIDNYRISMRDMGDGSFTPVSVFPIELAQEVEREYRETGGVFCYIGTGKPTPEQLRSAQERQLEWFRREYQKALDIWSRFHQHKFITDRQRDAAQALFKRGELSALPEWASVTRNVSEHISCPACDEKIRRGAKICRYCNYHLDAEWAQAHTQKAKARTASEE